MAAMNLTACRTCITAIPLSRVYYPPTASSPGSPGPLFFTQYSYMGYDPRGVHDRYSNYFQSNRNLSLVSWKYAQANPGHFKGYGADSWGLTAVDGPDDDYHEYRGPSPMTARSRRPVR